jgi:uncharacterized membrane protein
MTDPLLPLLLLLRYLHILGAIALMGGTIFMRFALVPSLDALSPDQRQTLQASLRARWARLVMLAITFLLISGLVSFLNIRQQFINFGPEHKLPTLYNALFGIKFLLALGIFFLASALAGRSHAFEPLRQNARFWLNVNLILALLVICISGVLRSMHSSPNHSLPEKPVAAVSSESSHG